MLFVIHGIRGQGRNYSYRLARTIITTLTPNSYSLPPCPASASFQMVARARAFGEGAALLPGDFLRVAHAAGEAAAAVAAHRVGARAGRLEERAVEIAARGA